MSCEIVIDTPGPYYAGNPLQGRIVCTLHHRFKIRGIKIRAYGDEHTEWMGTESYYNEQEKRHETRSILLTGDNKLFKFENVLHGGHGDEIHLGPGQFTYPFSIHIPQDLPATFENSYGYIRYTLKAIIDIPWDVDIEDLVHFTLLSLIDLNNFPMESFQPTSRSDEKTICCWCCAGGEMTVNINLAKCAFVPGDKLKLYVSLTNMSNVNVDNIIVEMSQQMKTHVNSPQRDTKEDKRVLASNSYSGVGAHGENNYDVEIPIPTNITVPNLKHSSLFEVNYDVQVTASVPGCHADMDLSFTVYMGHIQHRSQIPPAYEASGNGYPQQIAPPYPDATAPYPSEEKQQTAPAPPYPDVSAPYPTAPSQYSSYPQTGPGFVVPPSDPTPYPGASMYPSIPAEKQIYEGGTPSAPTFEAPPPSYGDATKKL